MRTCIPFIAGLTFLIMGARQGRADPISSVGPFTGTYTESWEEFNNYNQGPFYLSNPTTIMGGEASIADAHMIVYDPNAASFGLGTSGSAQVSDGKQGMLLYESLTLLGNGTATITFTNPVSEFGAYWAESTGGVLSDPNTVSLSFFDVFNNLIGTESFQYSHKGTSDGGLDWHGWSSTTPIGSLSYTGDFVATDGLQANPVVPEPASVTLASLGTFLVGATVWRRRNQNAKGQIQRTLNVDVIEPSPRTLTAAGPHTGRER